jgi:hypothetical protein
VVTGEGLAFGLDTQDLDVARYHEKHQEGRNKACRHGVTCSQGNQQRAAFLGAKQQETARMTYCEVRFLMILFYFITVLENEGYF